VLLILLFACVVSFIWFLLMSFTSNDIIDFFDKREFESNFFYYILFIYLPFSAISLFFIFFTPSEKTSFFCKFIIFDSSIILLLLLLLLKGFSFVWKLKGLTEQFSFAV